MSESYTSHSYHNSESPGASSNSAPYHNPSDAISPTSLDTDNAENARNILQEAEKYLVKFLEQNGHPGEDSYVQKNLRGLIDNYEQKLISQPSLETIKECLDDQYKKKGDLIEPHLDTPSYRKAVSGLHNLMQIGLDEKITAEKRNKSRLKYW